MKGDWAMQGWSRRGWLRGFGGQVILGGLAVGGVSGSVAERGDGSAPQEERAIEEKAIEKGRAFLVGLRIPELGLLPEFSGHRVVWLYHDNYLAAKVLEGSHPTVAEGIRQSIAKYGVERSGKIEMLFGEAELPLLHYELRDVAEVDGWQIRSEFVTDRIRSQRDIEGYADLLFFVAIAQTDPRRAARAMEQAMRMWDGVGFRDRATEHSGLYATYKLGLALIAANRLGSRQVPTPVVDRAVLAGIEQRLRSAQDTSGGWITDYRTDGSLVGKANVETTCLAILGIEALAALG
ncbi:MAG: hypothetical protein ACK5OB_17460 [Pirellula sp.]